MPDHCFDTSTYFPSEGLIDFEVSFNRQDKFDSTAITSVELSNQYRCGTKWLADDKILPAYRYKGYSDDTNNLRELIVGVSFNGVPIMSGVSEYGFDPFYPRRFTGSAYSVRSINVDDCLGHSSISGFYHYYSVSPCVLSSTLRLKLQPVNFAQPKLLANQM